MPAVSVSDSFWVKVAWIENFAAPADSLARAELTLVSEVWIVAIRAEALAWVEIVAVVVDRHDRTRQAHVLRRGGDAARAVGRGQGRDLVGRTVDQVEAVEHGILDDRGDLIAQGREVRVQRLAARGIERGVGGGKRLLLHLDQQVRNRLARGKGDVDGGRAVVEAVDDGLIAGHSAALVLGNGVDRAIVLRRRDLQAGVDGVLGLVELTLGLIEVLQRDHARRYWC